MEDLIKRLVSQEEANSNAIKVQEERALSNRRDLDRLITDTAEIRAAVHRIEVSSAATSGKVTCTAPNLCIDLRKQMEELARTVQTLTETRAEGRGALRMAVALSALMGTVGGALVTYTLKMLAKIP